MKTLFIKPAQANRKWYIIDATGKPLGDVAAKAAYLARGKHKACFTPHYMMGDFVVIVNAARALVTGKKAHDKMYYHHSHFPGGLKSFSYEKLLVRRPDAPMRFAVKGMLPKGPLGNEMRNAVKIYAGDEHPHKAQAPVKYEW